MNDYLFLFEKSSERLPKDELISVLEGEKIKYKIKKHFKKERIVLLDLKELRNEKIFDRIALTKRIVRIKSINKDLGHISKILSKELKTTFRVKAKSHSLEKELGASILKINPKLKVNLTKPDKEIYCIILRGTFYCGFVVPNFDNGFENRKPQNRPYFSPTSMHPKLARVLVNLARIKPGDTILDPFCGTGGLLIEGGLIGMKVTGYDFDEKAVLGAKKNLNHYKIKGGRIENKDAFSKTEKKFNAIITDLPYGQASAYKFKTRVLKEFYKTFLDKAYFMVKKRSYIVMVIPDIYSRIKIDKKKFEKINSYKIYVHKSLTRKVIVLKKNIKKREKK